MPFDLTPAIGAFHVQFPADGPNIWAYQLLYDVQNSLVPMGGLVDWVLLVGLLYPPELRGHRGVVRLQVKDFCVLCNSPGLLQELVGDPTKLGYLFFGQDVLDNQIFVLTIETDLLLVDQ